MEKVSKFEELSNKDSSIAGGKGASLGEMAQAGIPVPPGFVVLSRAFDKFVEDNQIKSYIDAELDKVDSNDTNSVNRASENINSMIKKQDFPDELKEDIINSFKDLDTKFVAVRSSATAEDSSAAAWAGQLETFLNTTEETLFDRIKGCWASLFTPRAIFYRFEKNLSKEAISVAVVVQKMVDSEESGIAFSVHPVTEDENQMVIEAGFGLGEAVVSGQITPDSYVVDKRDFSLAEKNVSEQSQGLYKVESGGSEWKELEKGSEQVLSEDKIKELAKLIKKIETHYGFPCDIEWAKERNKIYITQSRPITTLKNK